jgi:phosphatidylglycerol:prolipoprotein diacylglycerol transferase
MVFGARLGWWLFYHRPGWNSEPWYEPVATWHGGMSFHGGAAGLFISMLIWQGFSHRSMWSLADACVLVVPAGLFLGRVANFMNGELLGRPADLPWAVVLPGYTLPRHPSQLYEALLEGPALFVSLYAYRKWCRPEIGELTAAFLALYGAFRFLVEFTRLPDREIGYIAFGWLTMGQLLSATFTIMGMTLLFIFRKTSKNAQMRGTVETLVVLRFSKEG